MLLAGQAHRTAGGRPQGGGRSEQSRDIASAIDLQSKSTSMDPRLCGDDEHRRDSRMTFTAALKARWQQADTLVCVGLDPAPAKFPQKFAEDPAAIFAFCRDIVRSEEHTSELQSLMRLS